MATPRRYPIGCTLGVLLGSWALQALADPPAPTVGNNGLMTFPNVRVENAPIPAKATKAKAAQPKMMAYMGPNGLQEQPSANSGTPTTADASAASRVRTLSTSKTATDGTSSALASEPDMIYGPDSAVGVKMTDESMVFQVARRGADGKVSQQCVTGETQAKKALQSPVIARQHTDHQHKESHNAR